MLELHAAHLRGIHGRSAKLAFVVEQAAAGYQQWILAYYLRMFVLDHAGPATNR